MASPMDIEKGENPEGKLETDIRVLQRTEYQQLIIKLAATQRVVVVDSYATDFDWVKRELAKDERSIRLLHRDVHLTERNFGRQWR